MTATTDVDNHGFPQGYFVIRSVAMNRLLDVKMDESEDGTEVLLFPQREQSLVECTLLLSVDGLVVSYELMCENSIPYT